MTNNTSCQKVITLHADGYNGEMAWGNVKWTCSCGQPHFFDFIDIYDVVTCVLCGKKYEISLTAYLTPYDTSHTIIQS